MSGKSNSLIVLRTCVSLNIFGLLVPFIAEMKSIKIIHSNDNKMDRFISFLL